MKFGHFDKFQINFVTFLSGFFVTVKNSFKEMYKVTDHMSYLVKNFILLCKHIGIVHGFLRLLTLKELYATTICPCPFGV